MSSAGDPIAAFFANLRGCSLLRPAQLQELWAWTAVARPDVPALAKEISRRGWLTPFQIKEIFRGRGRELIIDRFVLQDLLGEGGMGRVYRATDTRMGRTVALKVIRREKLQHGPAQARFEQEVQALSKMKHPNVVDVFDAGKVGETHYYVMEYIDGCDLTKLVRDTGPLAVIDACDYIRQAALGLHHAFEKGLVHRDIKPSNILVSRTNRVVKLVDLGLARLMDQEPPLGAEAERITREGFVIGTPDFLAPEQARNPMAVDIRADIYALGSTLYYILTGKVPFDGTTPTEKLLKHCSDPPPPLLPRRPDAPPPVEHIIHWCMAKDPAARPQTPLQLALALQPFCPPAPTGFPSPTSGRHPITPVAPSSGSNPVPVLPTHPYPYGPPQPLPPDPARSSVVFRLPVQLDAADPIRRRARRSFPWATVLLGLGAIVVAGILGFAAYEAFLRPDEPPPESFTNSLGIRMVKLDGGTFRMGSPENEPGHRPDEAPQHSVTIRGPLLVAATEVSHSQYLKLMGSSPARSAEKAHRAQNRPVESVTWDEANEFCRKLTEVEKDQKWARKGWAYRLPTEAEWEYAARAGTTSPFAFGDHIVFEKQGLFRPTDGDLLGIGGEENPVLPAEVERGEANRFGLRYLHGNVAEWCLDWYRPGYPGDAARDNPTGPADGDKRVVRGGSFRDPAAATRSAARASARPNERRDDVGFRIVYAPLQK